jgi:hypothetical protein
MDNHQEPSKQEIELRAYEMYLARGASNGNELADWLAAEAELKRRTEERGVNPAMKRKLTAALSSKYRNISNSRQEQSNGDGA